MAHDRENARNYARELAADDAVINELRLPPRIKIDERVPFHARNRLTEVAEEVLEHVASDPDDAGAWITLLRLLVLGPLRSQGKGGREGARRVRSVTESWAAYKWDGCVRAAVESEKRRQSRTSKRLADPEMEKMRVEAALHASCEREAVQGRISKGLRRLEAGPIGPATRATLRELRRLHPPSDLNIEAATTPLGVDGEAAGRMQAVREQVLADDAPRFVLSQVAFAEAVVTMPISSATWLQPGHLRMLAKTRTGMAHLCTVSQHILDGRVPMRIRPLLFDWRMVALLKESHHAQSIEQLLAEHARNVESGPPSGCASVPVRPIAISDAFGWLAERAVVIQKRGLLRNEMLEYKQVGVAVPGGLELLNLAVTIMLESPDTALASLDIENMFNMFERLPMMEECVMPRPEENGSKTCLADLGRYLLMSYFENGGACGWFWVDEAGHPEGVRWHAVEMERGGNQGRPLTPAVAAMLLMRPLRRCHRLIDGILENEGVPVAQRPLLALLGAYLDDAVCMVTMTDGVRKVLAPFMAKYADELRELGWNLRVEKTVVTLSGLLAQPTGARADDVAAAATVNPAAAAVEGFSPPGGGDFVIDESGVLPEVPVAASRVPEGMFAINEPSGHLIGVDETDLGPVEQAGPEPDPATAMEGSDEEEGGAPEGPASTNVVEAGNRDIANLAPDVVQQLGSLPHEVLLARDGFVFLGTPAPAPPSVGPGPQRPTPTLGRPARFDGRLHDRSVVPVGPLDYQQRIAMRLVRQHDSRCHAIIRYVKQPAWRTAKVSKVRLQTAMHLVRFSCNARDIHLLRGLDTEAVAEAAAYHDRQIMATIGAITGQVDVVMGEGLGEVSLGRFKPEFIRGWRQACLPFTSGGLNFREWARYKDAAYAGKWSLAVRAARNTNTGIDYFPVVARELSVAENGGRRMPEAWSDCEVGTTRPAWALNHAWHRLCELAARTHAPDRPPTWMQTTNGDMARIEHAGERAQRMLSKTITLHLIREYKDGIRGEPVAQFVHKTAAAAGSSGWTAQPWQEDGQLTLHDMDVLLGFCVRLGLPVPRKWQGHMTGATITNDRGWDILGSWTGSKKWWDRCHNAVQRMLCDMIESAGGTTRMEPRTWDTGDVREEDGGGRRRPDIVAILSDGSEITVDVVGFWRHLTSFRSLYREGGAGAVEAEKGKKTRYEGALHRRHRTLNIGVPVDQWVRDQTADFYAAGFECTGALGPRMKELFTRIEESAQINTVGADLYHWSAMTFRNHWRAVIGATIMRFVARSLQGASKHAHRQRGVSGDTRPHDGLDSM